MIANDDDLITTRGEAWLCVIGVVLSTLGYPVLLALLVIDLPGTTGIVALSVVLLANLTGTVVLSCLWHARSRRRPDVFPDWVERYLYFHTAIWTLKRARYPTSFRRARQLLRARTKGPSASRSHG